MYKSVPMGSAWKPNGGRCEPYGANGNPSAPPILARRYSAPHGPPWIKN